MALISCPKCTNIVSNTAFACPNCGAPIANAAREQRSLGTPLSTIQETSKRLKLQIAIAALIWWIGILWVIIGMTARSGYPNSDHGSLGIPGFMLFFSTFWYFVTKIRIWWHHK
jgi:uncharacterized membrane protein YvbJ